ncbi:MAG TPA: prepilin-type N-terminal cleavage/methylation domain-containing protein [Candidatus Angelobacter sp.]|nr:prepilin-type N-terminal cleavage/methylation domain-containing protein [Candidatus Angelobacter sp.]
MPMVRTQHAIKSGRRLPSGFTLVEAMVVVMVILIIAAIAIPSLLRGKMRANEAAAVASVKTVETAQTIYFNAYPEVGYASSLPNLGTHGSSCDKPVSTASCIIMDDALTSGVKSGFIFEVVNDGNKPSMSYTVTATPETSASGRCAVSSGENGELHFSVAGTTASGSRSLGTSASASDCEM